MKNLSLVLFLSVVFLASCSNPVKKKETQNKVSPVKLRKVPPVKFRKISFKLVSYNTDAGIVVAYTKDTKSLWLDKDWVASVRVKMIELSIDYKTILLFSSKKHTPDVAATGMNYSTKYDQYMVSGYWIFPNGNSRFCYGGTKSDGNFRVCE
jgi:hypothetical protein